MKDKVLLVYKEDDEFKIESVWATKIGNYYKIDNIPFFAQNIALGDLVKIEEDGGALYFDELIESSGHSVVRMIIFNENEITEIGNELIDLGCNWEGSHLKKLIAIDVPKEIDYKKIKEYLEQGEKNKRWDFQEACLGFK